MSIKLEISHKDDLIQFINRDYGIMGFTDFTPIVWNELSKLNWYVDEKKFLNQEKTYIYTGSNRFGKYKDLHQIVMILWYGMEELQTVYEKNYIVEHHNNEAFDCRIRNLSFASNDLNLTKAHSFDKNQPKLKLKASVIFFKDFGTKQYQIVVTFTELAILKITEENSIAIDVLNILYDDNFRIVYTDANRIVDELLEIGKINFKVLSCKEFTYRESIFFVPKENEKITGLQLITDDNGQSYILVGEDAKDKFFFTGTNPDEELYK